MKLDQLDPILLKENRILTEVRSAMLWENAGRKLAEAELTPDQIKQIFQQVEKGATDAGSNRTLLGKGKDAAEAVNKAWEDLKTKIQNSGPIQGVDSAYDSAVAKIEAGLGGPDNKVNQLIQKYRKFAKDHPIAQGFIYSALIAAAGISGAGLGGAAVLGLLKMADKLLQGEKFSSAAYSGAKTGAMAYGASKVGDMIKGAQQQAAVSGEKVMPVQGQAELDQWGNAASKADSAAYAASANPTNPDGTASAAFKRFSNLDAAQQSAYGKIPTQGVGNAAAGTTQLTPAQAAALRRGAMASRVFKESQIPLLFATIATQQQLQEGIMDTLKGAAGKAADWAKTKGKNLTTKVTADKLMTAWQKAGSPTDSEALRGFLANQGVDAGVIDSALGPAAAQPAAQQAQGQTTPLAGGAGGIAKWYQAASPQERQALRKEMEIIDDQDRLASGANESKTYSKFLGVEI